MSYVRGEDRGQAALLPAAIEDLVTADAPVRVIDAFVDGLEREGARIWPVGTGDDGTASRIPHRLHSSAPT